MQVAQTCLNHLEMNAGSKKQRGVGVPQIVEMDVRQTGLLDCVASETVGESSSQKKERFSPSIAVTLGT